MSTSNQFIIRTEDIKPESILDLFVGTDSEFGPGCRTTGAKSSYNRRKPWHR